MVAGDTAEIDEMANPPVEDAETAAHGTQTAAGHGKVAITEPEATQETGLSDRQIETGASNPGAQQ